MAGLMDFNRKGARFQDYANFVLGVLLFIAPWALNYTHEMMAARVAWIGGLVVAILSLAAILRFAEWEEWVNLLIGAGVFISPYVFHFMQVTHAVATHYVLGALIVIAAATELWSVHHPQGRFM
ncbi:SPW repeat protein [Rhodoblastus sp.]|uniref:SPW repeat protein n=1 Tax=Rhodoblastus sp. TaxID=1962975 RepID=UPI0026277D26|nr:SPW repeat protein [Rhodoblastus sp.]